MKDIEKIAHSNGLGFVKAKIQEELEELDNAIDTNVEQDIIDEIADVFITCQQYVILTDTREQLKERMKYKIARTKERNQIK